MRTAVLLALVALAVVGCSDSDEFQRSTLGDPVTLDFGDQVVFPDGNVTLYFSAVNEDTRCPRDAVCPWGGQATITVAIGEGTALPVPLTLTIPGDDTAVSMGYMVTLVALAPRPTVEHPTEESEYEATIVVTPL